MSEMDFTTRLAFAFATLLLGSWLISLNLNFQTARWFIELVESMKWFLTFIAAIGLIVVVLFQIINQPTKPQRRVIEEIYEIAPMKHAEPTTRPPSAASELPPSLNNKIEPTKPKPEKRLAEEPHERSAFPPVEKTLNAQETLEASLNEF